MRVGADGGCSHSQVLTTGLARVAHPYQRRVRLDEQWIITETEGGRVNNHQATGCAAWLLLALYTFTAIVVGIVIGRWL